MGSNARETHPIFFHHVLQGLRSGTRMYSVDPRRTSTAQWADGWPDLDVGTDIAPHTTGTALMGRAAHPPRYRTNGTLIR